MSIFEIKSTGGAQAIASLDLHAAHFGDLHSRLEAASDLVYERTRQRFDSEGDGEWPELSEATVAKKVSQGYGEPARILYAEGNLYESATSPMGPYSNRIFDRSLGHESVAMLVDWENDGWQIGTVLAEGSDRGLPARPIWPPADQIENDIAALLLRGL
jgi:hypothetical protein